MRDGGFITGHAGKIRAVATQAQLGHDYEVDLRKVVADAIAQAKVWQPGPKDELLKGVAGRLKIEVTQSTDPKRAAVLKEAVEMLLAACSKAN